MKKHHEFAYYCTLLLPVGILIGAGAGRTCGLPVVLTILGAGAAIAASYALARTRNSSESI